MGAYEFGADDSDCDRSVEPDNDFVGWTDCMSGPSPRPFKPNCAAFDLDSNRDSDLFDFSIFQAETTDCPN